MVAGVGSRGGMGDAYSKEKRNAGVSNSGKDQSHGGKADAWFLAI
jgi:hypothetical protein